MSIKDVIIKALIAIEPQIVNHMNRGTKFRHVCFEVYGFDILLDHTLKPWLLEVNVSPSLSSSSPFDKKVKTMLVCDTMNLVGVTPYDRRRHEREVEEQAKNRLLGLEKSPSKQGSRGCVNDAKNKLSLEKLGEDDLNLLYDFDEEENRAHNYTRIFPLQNNVDKYERFFEFSRYNNEMLWGFVRQGGLKGILKEHAKKTGLASFKIGEGSSKTFV